MQPQAAAQSPVARPHRARLSPACTLAACCFGVILGRTKMISIPFFHQKCAKWNTNHGDHGDHGAPEMQPQAAAQSPVPHAPGARIT